MLSKPLSPSLEDHRSRKRQRTDRKTVAIQSLVIVPGSHNLSLVDGLSCKTKNPDFCMFNSPDSGLLDQAVLVDHRPVLGNPNATTLVLWRSSALHCSARDFIATDRRKVRPSFSPPLTTRNHFWAERQKTEWLACLNKDGYVVLEFEHETEHTSCATRRLREALEKMNASPIPQSTDPYDALQNITEHHLPPLKSLGLRGYYGMAQTPFADGLRMASRFAFAHIHQVENDDPRSLTCSLDSAAYSPNVTNQTNKQWLHVDQNPDNKMLCVQGTICVHTDDALNWARVGQHVCWMPTVQREPGTRQKLQKIRYSGASSTHWPTRAIMNQTPVPAFRPPPKSHLKVTFPVMETDRAMFDALVPLMCTCVAAENLSPLSSNLNSGKKLEPN